MVKHIGNNEGRLLYAMFAISLKVRKMFYNTSFPYSQIW